MRVGMGAPEPVPAERLLALSDVVLPGVLSCDRRKGAAAAGLRVAGVEATLAPLDGVAPHELVGLTRRGGETERVRIDVAMEMLGLSWAALDGTAAEPLQEAAVRRAKEAELEETWLAGREQGPAAWRRLAAFRAVGLVQSDDAALT
eukprot:991750-Pleurochrysis_carterae.AAC.1